MKAPIVQWLEFAPSKHEVRVRFPVGAFFFFFFLFFLTHTHSIYQEKRACGVMVSTRDSESLDPGSNPGRPLNCFFFLDVYI